MNDDGNDATTPQPAAAAREVVLGVGGGMASYCWWWWCVVCGVRCVFMRGAGRVSQVSSVVGRRSRHKEAWSKADHRTTWCHGVMVMVSWSRVVNRT